MFISKSWFKISANTTIPVSGTLLACLVNCIAPGLLPNYTILNPDDKVENVKLAMDLAETWLGVPKLLAPEDMASTSVSLILGG